MLSAYRLEKINGHAPSIVHDTGTGKYQAYCECNCERSEVSIRICGERHPSESAALESLRDKVLSEHGRIVMQKAKWACVECGRVVPLQADHIVARSHGRNDRCENLRPLCQRDHERRHGSKDVHRVDISESP